MVFNFSIIHPHIAGLGCPNSVSELDELVFELKVCGLVSLTEEKIESIFRHLSSENPMRKEAETLLNSMERLHLPVQDFCPPTILQLLQSSSFILSHHDNGRLVAVHCAAGRGRTGTMLTAAAFFFKSEFCGGERKPQIISVSETLDWLRSKRPGSVETLPQQQILQEFNHWIAKDDGRIWRAVFGAGGWSGKRFLVNSETNEREFVVKAQMNEDDEDDSNILGYLSGEEQEEEGGGAAFHIKKCVAIERENDVIPALITGCIRTAILAAKKFPIVIIADALDHTFADLFGFEKVGDQWVLRISEE